MSTYFVNAGGSNTPPFDTPAKGATNLSNLVAVKGNFCAPFAAGDIVEVVDNGLIDQSFIQLFGLTQQQWTIRSYGSTFVGDPGTKDADDPDRYLNKPTIKLANDASIHFICAGACATVEVIVNNLKVFKDEHDGELSNPILQLGPNTNTFLENTSVIGCELYCVLDTGLVRCEGIKTLAKANSTDPDNQIKFNNNIIYNVSNGINVSIYLPTNGQNVSICNNTIYDFTGYGITRTSGCDLAAVFNNIIHGHGLGTYGINYASATTPTDYNDIFACTLGTIETGTGGLNNISVDPLFVDAANGDFTLSVDSTCIDAGAGVGIYAAAPVIDFRQVVRPTLYPNHAEVDDGTDIGAYEMTSVTPPQPGQKKYFKNLGGGSLGNGGTNIYEKITTPDYNDPHFAVFTGSVNPVKNVSTTQVIKSVAGILQGIGGMTKEAADS